MDLMTQVSCEVEEVLAHTKKELVQKIPKHIIEFFLENSKNVTDYKAKYNADLPLEQQNLLQETKGILTLFYRDYWCTEEEKVKLDKVLNDNEIKYQEELREKYNPDVFEKSNKINSAIVIDTPNVPMIITNKKWYEKILEKIKNFLFKLK